MRFLLLATDYDGTIASEGKLNDQTLAALERLRASGRKLVLVTGRHLDDLCKVFSRIDLFDRVVAENGALLYRPETRHEEVLSAPPDERFVSLLKKRKIAFSVGHAVVSTWQPHEAAVLEAIRDSGLDLQLIFNKGAVMVLPSGINKGTGLKAALDQLQISPHNVIGVGDAENDHSFLAICECAAAVANALPSLKERADIVLDKERGDGVIELCEDLIRDDLAKFDAKLQRHAISLGSRIDNEREQVLVSPRGESILVAGSSGSGKSTTVSGILEQLLQHGYQFCLIDPEGDYEGLPGVLTFGTAKERPEIDNVFRALEFADQSVVVNLLGISVEDRPGFFSKLLLPMQDLRARTARPHWIIVDEAHHLLPSSWAPANATLPQVLERPLLITVHPEHVAEAALNPVQVVVAIGKAPLDVFRSFANVLQISPPKGKNDDLPTGEALVWFRNRGEEPIHVKAVQSSRERLRHVRQYAEGELSPEQSFYFRGPESKLNLRAHNLKTFLQLAQGVDDETWTYHLRKRDYSAWFKTMIKDDELARQAAQVEQDKNASPKDSREQIKEAVESRYTAPA